eukprot:2001123-Pyramimonas_sp.AAC.1
MMPLGVSKSQRRGIGDTGGVPSGGGAGLSSPRPGAVRKTSVRWPRGGSGRRLCSESEVPVCQLPLLR